MRELAQQLMAVEARRTPSRDTANTVPRVFEALRSPLSRLAGVSGFRSLLSRALTVATVQEPALCAVTVEADASLIGFDEMQPRARSEGGVIFIAQLLALLSAFIGEELTMHLLRDVWPDLTSPNPKTSPKGNHDATR